MLEQFTVLLKRDGAKQRKQRLAMRDQVEDVCRGKFLHNGRFLLECLRIATDSICFCARCDGHALQKGDDWICFEACSPIMHTRQSSDEEMSNNF